MGSGGDDGQTVVVVAMEVIQVPLVLAMVVVGTSTGIITVNVIHSSNLLAKMILMRNSLMESNASGVVAQDADAGQITSLENILVELQLILLITILYHQLQHHRLHHHLIMMSLPWLVLKPLQLQPLQVI